MSNTNARRKGYVIGYSHNDLLHHNGRDSEPVSLLPAGLLKYVDKISRSDITLSGSSAAVREQVREAWPDQQYVLVTRRAAARRIAQVLNEKMYHTRIDFHVLEVGDFKREVKPVKHWNIERRSRKRHCFTGKREPWAQDLTPYQRGISLRKDARDRARQLSLLSNSSDSVWEYKYTAVPVYA